MLKIPSFILGGILILTGLIGYLAQDLSLSIKLSGPWASDAEFILSDGQQSEMLDFIPSDSSAGENAYWIVYKLNQGHAKDVNKDNNSRALGSLDGELQSFWYASSSGETMDGLFQESENYQNAGSVSYEPVTWEKIDPEEAKVRFIYRNISGTDGPVTLTSNNWENVIDAPKAGESLEFGKSWTAFIPSILGLILIVLAIAADKAPNAKKHIMHFAVLVGLLGFLSIVGKVGAAFSEMSWWRSEPFHIYAASSLKPTTMLLSAGLLLIYLILSVVSFVSARKEMAAQAERDAARKAIAKKKAEQNAKNNPNNESDKESPKSNTKGKKIDENDKKPVTSSETKPKEPVKSDKGAPSPAKKGKKIGENNKKPATSSETKPKEPAKADKGDATSNLKSDEKSSNPSPKPEEKEKPVVKSDSSTPPPPAQSEKPVSPQKADSTNSSSTPSTDKPAPTPPSPQNPPKE
jgi:hypothetical protein